MDPKKKKPNKDTSALTQDRRELEKYALGKLGSPITLF